MPITKATPLATIIDDFVHSDNPKFAGKSKEDRIKMAKGAFYGMQKEDLDESVNIWDRDKTPSKTYDTGHTHGFFREGNKNVHKVGSKLHSHYEKGYADGIEERDASDAKIADSQSRKNESVHPSIITHDGKKYHKTGKVGQVRVTGAKSAEYEEHDEEGNATGHRLWHRADGKIDTNESVKTIGILNRKVHPKREATIRDATEGNDSHLEPHLQRGLSGTAHGYTAMEPRQGRHHALARDAHILAGREALAKGDAELANEHRKWAEYHHDMSGDKDQNESIKLINAIAEGDTIKSSELFGAALMSKVFALIEERRQEVAQNMFNEGSELDEAKDNPLGLSALKSVVNADSAGKDKEGNHVFRHVYFYRHGNNSKKTSDRVVDALTRHLPNHDVKLVDHSDVWKPFRGGSSAANSSHFKTTVKITPKVSESVELGEAKHVSKSARESSWGIVGPDNKLLHANKTKAEIDKQALGMNVAHYGKQSDMPWDNRHYKTVFHKSANVGDTYEPR